MSQFEHVSIIYHRWSLIRTRFQLHRVLEGIEAEPGPVLSTLMDRALRNDLETTCARLGVPVVNVLDPVMGLLQERSASSAVAGRGGNMCWMPIISGASTPCISCWPMTTARRRRGLPRRMCAWSGVSRSSKTPTSFYLANRGVKAANVPLVPGMPDPPGLESRAAR